jgi:AraC-like DNA-binding protein
MSRLDRLDNWLNVARRSKYNSSRLAKNQRISTSQLRRYFVSVFYRPPQEWLEELRIFDSMRMLASGSPIKEVSYRLGLRDVSHFCHQFKRFHGCTPTKFIQLYHEKLKRDKREIANALNGRLDRRLLPPPPWQVAIQSLCLTNKGRRLQTVNAR